MRKNIIVLNEVDFAEEAIAERRIRYSAKDTISRLARYYNQVKGHTPAETTGLLSAFIEAAIPVSGQSGWKRQAAAYAANTSACPLSRLDCIVVTDAELAAVRKTKSALKERLLFTLIVLVKYYNAIREGNENWVGLDLPTIFSLANIKHSGSVRLGLLSDLSDAGLIRCGGKLTSTALQVLILNDSGKPAAKVFDMRNLGWQYNALDSNEYTVCADCGVTIRRRGNHHKYCADCLSYHRMHSALNAYSQQINAV